MQQNITEETKLDIKRLNHVMEVCLNTYVRRSHRLFEINRQLFFHRIQRPFNNENKYTKHSSKGKYLFMIPTHEYLKHLSGHEFDNYEKTLKVLTKNPLIYETNENRHLIMEEYVKNGSYL